jgi:hypothetical protein
MFAGDTCSFRAKPDRGFASLEPEADARDSGKVVVLNVAVGDATFCDRVHDAGIGIPLRQEPPVENR